MSILKSLKLTELNIFFGGDFRNLIRENTSRFLSAKFAKYSTSISFPLSIGDIKPKLALFKVIFESDGKKPRISISSFLKTSLINFLCLSELTLLNIIPAIDNSLSKSLKPRIVAKREAT